MRGPIAEALFRLRAGPLRFVRWIVDRARDRLKDREFGISCAQRKAEGARVSADSAKYQPVSYRDLHEILEALPIAPDDVFLDFGAGMGRAVCVAATYPFRAVIGVELAPDLCEIARQNIKRIAPKLLCSRVEIVESDALAYPIPPEVSLFFFFNPFSGATLDGVLGNIGRSLKERPRNARIIFVGTLSSKRFREVAARYAFLRLSSERILATGISALIYKAGLERSGAKSPASG
jgi:SAM-dependent methyltransferase